MLEGAKSIGVRAVTIMALAGAAIGWGTVLDHLLRFFDFTAHGDRWFFLLFLTLILGMAARTLYQFRSPLYQEPFIKELVRHHLSSGHLMILQYNWFGVSLHINKGKQNHPLPQTDTGEKNPNRGMQ